LQSVKVRETAAYFGVSDAIIDTEANAIIGDASATAQLNLIHPRSWSTNFSTCWISWSDPKGCGHEHKGEESYD
jgi:hypothetical protein